MTVTVFGYLIFISIDFYDFKSPCTYSLVLVIYQTRKTVFDHISKHFKVGQKYSAARRVFNSPLGVWKCGQTRSVVIDVLLMKSNILSLETDSVQFSFSWYTSP